MASTYPAADPQVFYDLSRDRLATQLATLDAVDNKVGLLFSTSSGLLGILAAVIALRSSAPGAVEYTAIGLSIFSFLVVARYSERAYRCRDWNVGPNLRQVYVAYKAGADTERSLQWEIANHLRKDYEANKNEEARKSDALRVILLWVVTQSLILAVTLIFVAAGA